MKGTTKAANTQHRPPSWLETANFYQIYPQSFYDTNGDGIGDIPGIIAKLDYIQSLGISALWLSPVFESPFGDAGYDVSDFYKVAPRYGSNSDLERLFEEAHRRGMRICLDLVAGHTSNQHPWFKASAQAKKNRYTNWYVWTDSAWTADEPNAVRGFSDRDGGYLPNFFSFQPALNYGYAKPDPAKKWQLPISDPAVQAVRRELGKIMKFWLDLGADGFRVDMAASLVRGDADGRGIRELWRSYRQWLDKDYPEAVLIAEWCNPRRTIGAGFDIDFLIHFGEPAYNALLGTPWGANGEPAHRPPVFFDRKGRGDIRRFLDNYLPHYRATRGRGYISLPTGNHDFPRHRRGREERDQRVIYAMLFTMPGVPFLYYGDEIGMRYIENLTAREGSYANRTGTRTPMQWRRGRNAGFSTAPSSQLYLPVDPAPDAPNVEQQERDPKSLLNLTRRFLALRLDHPALGNLGGFRPIHAKAKKYPFVYERFLRGERFWIAINPTERAIKVALPAIESAETVEALDAELTAGSRKSDLLMEPVSFGIFRIRIFGGR
ncbi:MAG: alpha-amylase family glycosyl hydrolase [Terrimicrobiaceae bacterium]|nr:alpha-amylase family glycosyl hydrolase [Terrimicrobiaceae bacterium]